MAGKLMYTNSFDGGVWNVYFRKWQLTKEKKRESEDNGKKMI